MPDNSILPPIVLAAAEYTDWHISVDRPEMAVLFPGPRPLPPADDMQSFAKKLAGSIVSSFRNNHHSFVVECDGFRYRAQHIEKSKFALRLLKKRLWPMEKLGYLPEHANMLLSEDLKAIGGLVLVSGAAGSGKTTTVGTVLGARLSKFGGYCLTVEDPPEEPLAGWHANIGYCEQMEVIDGNFEEAIYKGLRCFPSMDRATLLVGEVRSKHAAAELLRVAIDGHLVFSTIHANSPIGALQRLLYLASEELGERAARNLLADSLRLSLTQRLEHDVPQVSVLKSDQTCSAIIRDATSDLSGLQDRLNRKPAGPTIKPGLTQRPR